MDKNNYLEMVAEQIRFEKAKKLVADELENHIEDQKDAFLLDGMNETEAFQKAVEEMGDPVEVGIALDRIHRSKIEWNMLFLILGLSLLGLFLQYMMLSDMGTETYPYPLTTQFINVIVGFMVMLFFCFFDYTRIGLWGKIGGAAILLLLLFSIYSESFVSGQSGYLYLFGKAFSMHQFIYLYIPFFGGILYSYRNKARAGFIKSILWMLVPVFLVLMLPSLPLASCLLMIMLLQICFAVKKGWFFNCHIRLRAIISVLLGIPAFLLVFLLLFGNAYQKTRLLSVVTLSGDASYQIRTARELLLHSLWIGQSADGVGGVLPDMPSDFILTYVFSYYGILAAIVFMAVLGFFVLWGKRNDCILFPAWHFTEYLSVSECIARLSFMFSSALYVPFHILPFALMLEMEMLPLIFSCHAFPPSLSFWWEKKVHAAYCSFPLSYR